MKIKSILISQPKPSTEKSPYFEIEEKHKVKLYFKQFIQIEGVSTKEFRTSKVGILEHSAIIFTSRTSIDHFFHIAEQMRVQVPDDMKYFCTSESIAVYLQKYIVYRKRKIFFGQKRFIDLMDVLCKHKTEKFLIPVADIHKEEISKLLNSNKINHTKAVFYRTVSSDLADIEIDNFDVLVFYSPSGIVSLYNNFPDFAQNATKIATFGPNTAKAAKDAGLKVDLKVPSPDFPSMTMALDHFITEQGKRNGI
ncbi:MAG: uroporphyrinogen-III synthase [Bacteroidetes bacterium]|nr:uroporphyrinogen-III synthase [Bacteroidota bacterium]MBT4398397.1 uroporphyrinogen-III synthase [Bacteroidota bacterium]MBT4411819.1 uroporphyrinogen-III synthase [Bacteroidota bacterium]MBT7094342.1 uroporphyrinogen-III synthase [Bacteroidota bacterium]MBT7462755.1 uroporphyrinogen-III synthase [Bacteroidota bacterium]